VVDSTERTSSDAQVLARTPHPYLFLVLEAARLEGSGMRLSLGGIAELAIGRGTTRALSPASGEKRALSVADPRMSTTHARIVRKNGGYRIVDAGSTNGTLRNGAPVNDAPLQDGDILELGQTSFLFRTIVDPEATAAAPDLDVHQLPALPLGLATFDPLLARRFSHLARIGGSPLSAMLLGETGTGKEVLARALHQLSQRPGPFIAVNCGAIPQNLVESHLFGHVKGAFSGAVRDEPGLVRAANFGTLLLDEIGDLPASSQAALLRVLQEGEVLPIGSVHPIKVDVRILSATHRPLAELIAAGTFRRDLYARLAGYAFDVPPLRDRTCDLGMLVANILASGRIAQKKPLKLHREAARAMVRYEWPMNVRELEQCLRASSVLSEDGLVTVRQLPSAIAESLVEDAAKETEPLTESEQELRRDVVAKLTETKGNVSEVARLMGKARQQVQRWIRRFALDPESFRQ
jgi:transcriptional regulator of acetoin/glycerol metabolism